MNTHKLALLRNLLLDLDTFHTPEGKAIEDLIDYLDGVLLSKIKAGAK